MKTLLPKFSSSSSVIFSSRDDGRLLLPQVTAGQVTVIKDQTGVSTNQLMIQAKKRKHCLNSTFVGHRAISRSRRSEMKAG